MCLGFFGLSISRRRVRACACVRVHVRNSTQSSTTTVKSHSNLSGDVGENWSLKRGYARCSCAQGPWLGGSMPISTVKPRGRTGKRHDKAMASRPGIKQLSSKTHFHCVHQRPAVFRVEVYQVNYHHRPPISAAHSPHTSETWNRTATETLASHEWEKGTVTQSYMASWLMAHDFMTS